MQIAHQVFGIETAENALVFFQNGEPAYLTKRFDVTDQHEKKAVKGYCHLSWLREIMSGNFIHSAMKQV